MADKGKPAAERQSHDELRASTVLGILGIVAVVVVARQLVLEAGWVIGNDGTRLLTLMAIGIAVSLVALIMRNASVSRLIAGAAALVGLFAATELVFPAVPQASAPAACDGAQTRGVRFLATTHPDGVSVREGPGRSFQQRDRLLGDCSVGFVGYCLGEPTLDVFYREFGQDVADARWLVLPRGRGYVAAGAVRSQEAEDRLPRPNEDCPSNEFDIETPRVAVAPGPVAGEAVVTASAEGAPTVGFATYHVQGGQPVFTRLTLDADPSGDFGFVWVTEDQPAPDGAGRGDVMLVAVACLAAEVPGPATADLVPLTNGGLPSPSGGDGPPADLASIPQEHRERLLRKACLLPGDETPPVRQPA